MMKSRLCGIQIVLICKETGNRRQAKDICREHGISTVCFYQWESKYGGLEASDLKRLKDLEVKNNLLKKMSADMALENRAIKDPLGKL